MEKSKEAEEEAKMTGDDLTTPTTTTTTTPAIDEARKKASDLNAALLATDQEHTFMSLKKEKDNFSTRCTSQQVQISQLHGSVGDLVLKLSEMEAAVAASKQKADREARKAQESIEKEKDASERAQRVFMEADMLRREISRLTNDNKSLNTQLSELRASTALSSSSTAPYQYEVSRLKAELESVNAHTAWLESELSSRTTQVGELKIQTANELQTLNRDLAKALTEKDDLELDLSNLKLRYDNTQQKLETTQKEMLIKEENHADVMLEKDIELNSERRLVTLSRENLARTEDRYNDAIREIDTMKKMAAVAVQEQSDKIEQLQNHFKQEMDNALREAADANAKKVAEVQKRLQEVIVEKTQLEDEFMAGSQNNALTQEPSQNEEAAGQPLRLGYTSDTGELITLTDLYEKLAEAQKDAQKEREDRRRVELYLERVHRDIEKVAPKQQQQRREYELAMSERKDMQHRLSEALQDCEEANYELQRKEKQSKEFELECQELKQENTDLAMQVQALLKKSLGTIREDMTDDLTCFGSVDELQSQNQRLLKEHHRLSSNVSELEKKLNSDSIHLKLQEAETAVKEMEEERENQASLVASIVQQRDLYRALVVKNDAQILAEADGAGTAIVAAKDQIERLADTESKNKELSKAIIDLKAELSTSVNAKEGLEERLARLDAHANDMSLSNTKLQSELCTANASIARSVAESSFKTEKLERLEENLNVLKAELEHVRKSKEESQKMNDELQSMVFHAKADASKHEEQLRQSEMKLRLAETKVHSLQATEARLLSETTSLRNELSKHGALYESMQKIEGTLSGRVDEDRERLRQDVKSLENALSSEKTKNATMIQKLQNKLDDAEFKVESLRSDLEGTQRDLMNAKDTNNAEREELHNVKQKYGELEKTYQAAKIQLGEEDIDVSFTEKVEALTSQLQSTKADLVQANQKATDYQSMAKASEKSLLELSKVSEQYKEKVMTEIEGLKSALEVAKKTAKAKQDALTEISQDLGSRRTEQEKNITELKLSKDKLAAELESSKKDCAQLREHVDSLKNEVLAYKADASAAMNNYERELALHSSALTSLRESREGLEKEKDLRLAAESSMKTFREEWSVEQKLWEDTKAKFEQAEEKANANLEEAKKQNDILHDQLDVLSKTLDKSQSSTATAQSEGGEGTGNPEQLTQLQKQLAELREVVRYLRSERDVLDTQLQTARRSSQRELAKADITKKELDAARAELSIIQKREIEVEKSDDGLSLKNKLKEAEQQLILLNESNKLLRDESEKLGQKLSIGQKEASESYAKIMPLEKKCQDLELTNSALLAEKKSLLNEVDNWKDRVSSLVTKFHQIDPEDHAAALAKVEESRKECDTLKASKLQSEKEAAGAKSLVSRLNKDLSKHKSLVESTKKLLEKTTSEKDKLVKSSDAKAEAYQKEIQDLKSSKKQLESELKTRKTEFEQQKGRVENLTKMLRNNKKIYDTTQQKLQEAQKKELDLKKQLAKEMGAKKKTIQKSNEAKIDKTEAQNESAKRGTSSSVDIPSSTPKASAASTPVSASDTQSTVTGTDVSQNKEKVTTKNITRSQIPNPPQEGFLFAPSPTPESKSQMKTSTPSVAPESLPANKGGSTEVVSKEKKTGTKPEPKATLRMKESGTPRSNTRSEAKTPIAQTGSKQTLNTTSTPIASSKPSDQVSSAKDKKENNLREKIMKKKRQLEEMKGKSTLPMPPTKRSEPHATKDAPKADSSSAPAEGQSLSISKEIVSGPETKKESHEQVSSDKMEVETAATDEIAPNVDDPGNATKIGTLPPLDESEASTSSSMNKPTAEQPTSQPSGAFLDNLKPPGSSLSSPLVFGSSPNIQLPTPSKLPTHSDSVNPFNAFETAKVETKTDTTSASAIIDVKKEIFLPEQVPTAGEKVEEKAKKDNLSNTMKDETKDS